MLNSAIAVTQIIDLDSCSTIHHFSLLKDLSTRPSALVEMTEEDGREIYKYQKLGKDKGRMTNFALVFLLYFHIIEIY